MKVHSLISRQSTIQSAAQSPESKGVATGSAVVLTDNRPQTTIQRKLSEANQGHGFGTETVQRVERVMGNMQDPFVQRVMQEAPIGPLRVKQEDAKATQFLVIVPYANNLQVHIHYHTNQLSSQGHIYTDGTRNTRVEINGLIPLIQRRFDFRRLIQEAKARHAASVYDEYGGGQMFQNAVQRSNGTYRRGDDLLTTTYAF